MDYYELLGVLWMVSVDEIKSVYCKFVFKLYFDCNKEEGVVEKFVQVSEVYLVLSDIEKCVYYDCFGLVFGVGMFGGDFFGGMGGMGGVGFDFMDIFEQLFGGVVGMGGCGWCGLVWGDDFEIEVCIMFEQVCVGEEVEVMVDCLIECEYCYGICIEFGGKLFVICLICNGSGVVCG